MTDPLQRASRPRPHHDCRSIRTRETIHRALTELLVEKKSGDITVTELAKKAQINRKTFYNYYSGIPDVIDELENDIAERIGQMLSTINFAAVGSDPEPFLCQLADRVQKVMDEYGSLLIARSEPRLVTKIVASMKKELFRLCLAQFPGNAADSALYEFLIDYTLGGISAVYRKWYETNRSLPLEIMARAISVIMLNGILGILRRGKAWQAEKAGS